MVDFITKNAQLIFTIYSIGAIITFVAVSIFFWYIGREEERENEIFSDECEQEKTAAGTAETVIAGIIIAFGCAILWWAFPILIIALILICTISKKYQKTMGDITDNEEREEKA